jgi:hypothetical protein
MANLLEERNGLVAGRGAKHVEVGDRNQVWRRPGAP